MSKPANCISVVEAKSLRNNWETSRGASLSSSRGAEDTSDFTFSLEEMEEFLGYVKEESKKQGITNPGIRVYFAAYNARDTNQATVFLAPTKGTEADSDTNYDVEPLNRGSQGWPPNSY